MQNKPFKFGPVALSATLGTNILNPGTLTGGVNATAAPYASQTIIITHLRAVNKTAAPVTVSLWLGATGANAVGTEFAWQAYSVPANSYIDWYGRKPMAPADFLVGGAGTAAAMSIEGDGETGVL